MGLSWFLSSNIPVICFAKICENPWFRVRNRRRSNRFKLHHLHRQLEISQNSQTWYDVVHEYPYGPHTSYPLTWESYKARHPSISSKLGKQRKQHMFLKSRIHKTGNMGFQVLINMRPAYFGDSCSVTEDLMDQRAVDMRKQGARVRPSAKILTSERLGVPRLGRDLDEVSWVGHNLVAEVLWMSKQSPCERIWRCSSTLCPAIRSTSTISWLNKWMVRRLSAWRWESPRLNSSQGRIGSSDNGSSRCSRTRRSGKVLCLQMSAVNLERDHALNTPTQILVEDKRQALSTGHSWIQRKAAKVDYGEGTRI